MDAPPRRSIADEPVDILGQNQRRQDLAHPVDQVRRQEPGVIILKKTAQSPMADGENNQDTSVRLGRSLCNPYSPELTLPPETSPG